MSRSSNSDARVWAVLGPTNTGKTHLAVERMLGHPTGMIGLPLRLLAREVYDRVVAAKGASQAALVTGEERIVPATARYIVSTVEAMPLDRTVSFLAVDEIQLAADPDRGYIFTDRLLRARGSGETMFLGSDTIRPLIRSLIPGIEIQRRERLSRLAYSGPRKITKLARRTAIVAFSAEEVYAIAELIRRHKGGAAVVMGALSPRTRNAQVALYQSGEVDFMVATDAIGMGLNMEVEHVAFASLTKFDGRVTRPLRPDEVAQIAGRAGRFRTDGTFGETGECGDIDPETVERVEGHSFEPLEALEWRAARLDFDSTRALIASLEAPPPAAALRRARAAVDEETLRRLVLRQETMARVTSPWAVRRLWDLCQLPEFRRVPLDEHVALVESLARHLLAGKSGRVPSDWFARRVAEVDRTDGDIEQLQQRLATIRVWTYAANRADWVDDAEGWRGRTRQVEDRLSDTLHERLMQRFIDRRTSALLKGLKREAAMAVEVSPEGDVTFEGHHLGRLTGLRFEADPEARGLEERALRNAALQALRPELAARLMAIVAAGDEAFTLGETGEVRFQGAAVARLQPRQPLLAPKLVLVGGELGPDELRRQAGVRLDGWIAALVARELAPLLALQAAAGSEALKGLARGVAFRLAEAGGVMARRELEADLPQLSQEDRAGLRRLGVRFGRAAVYLPLLLKPRPARLHAVLAFHAEGRTGAPWLPPPGLTSFEADASVHRDDYRRGGFQVLAGRAVRLDILDRVADALYEAGKAAQGPAPLPLAAVSLLGASNEVTEAVVTALGWEKIMVPQPPAPGATAVPGPGEQVSGAEGPAEPDASDAVQSIPALASGETPDGPQDAIALAAPPAASPGGPEASASPETRAGVDPSAPPADTSASSLVEEPPLVAMWRPARVRRPDGGGRAGWPGGPDRGPGRRDDKRSGQSSEGRGRGGRGGHGAPDGPRPGDGGRDRRSDGRSGSRGPGGGPPGTSDTRGGRGQAPRRIEVAPPGRGASERAVDPNNPFAALLALKAQPAPPADVPPRAGPPGGRARGRGQAKQTGRARPEHADRSADPVPVFPTGHPATREDGS